MTVRALRPRGSVVPLAFAPRAPMRRGPCGAGFAAQVSHGGARSGQTAVRIGHIILRVSVPSEAPQGSAESPMRGRGGRLRRLRGRVCNPLGGLRTVGKPGGANRAIAAPVPGVGARGSSRGADSPESPRPRKLCCPTTVQAPELPIPVFSGFLAAPWATLERPFVSSRSSGLEPSPCGRRTAVAKRPRSP